MDYLKYHTYDQLNIPSNKRASVMIDFKVGELQVNKKAAVVKKLFPFYQYLKQNYKEMLPTTVVYFRKCLHVFIRNDGMFLHRDNGDIVCQDCLHFNNIATDTTNKRKALISKINKLFDQHNKFNDIGCHKVKDKQELAFANENLVNSKQIFHECYLQCLILKPLVSISNRKNKTKNAKDDLFEKF